MAKLNIDFAVNLGNSVGEINKVVTALTNLNLQVNDLAKNLSSLSNKKIAPKVEAEIKLKETSIAPMKVKVDAELPKGPLGNVFDRYIQGATNAKTVTEFLKEEEKRLTAEIKNLQQVAGNTTSLVKYTSALKQIGEKSKQLSAIKLADPFNKLSASANQANLTLVNVGRVAQDLPFGFLGIANNLNPLVESFKALKDEAKLAGTSVKSQLLASLKGFGGVGLAISAVSAALSFASVGLQYWNRNTKEGMAQISGKNLRMVGIEKLKKGKKTCILIPIHKEKSNQIVEFRRAVVLNNLHKQDKALIKKSQIVNIAKYNGRFSKSQLKYIQKQGGMEKMLKNIEKDNNCITLSNRGFGKKVHRSQSTGYRLQRTLRMMGYIKSYSRRVVVKTNSSIYEYVELYRNGGYVYNKDTREITRQLSNEIVPMQL